ncbi:hypothetical protein ACLB2K_026157 [Fragaria x ananassa]
MNIELNATSLYSFDFASRFESSKAITRASCTANGDSSSATAYDVSLASYSSRLLLVESVRSILACSLNTSSSVSLYSHTYRGLRLEIFDACLRKKLVHFGDHSLHGLVHVERLEQLLRRSFGHCDSFGEIQELYHHSSAQIAEQA